jgi:hypothetical protein
MPNAKDGLYRYLAESGSHDPSTGRFIASQQ